LSALLASTPGAPQLAAVAQNYYPLGGTFVATPLVISARQAETKCGMRSCSKVQFEGRSHCRCLYHNLANHYEQCSKRLSKSTFVHIWRNFVRPPYGVSVFSASK
jgi:hypothetical protein